jgi:hypothetical protein
MAAQDNIIAGIGIVITGDTSRLQADFANAQAIAQRAGGQISSALTSALAPGMKAASGLVDQFGRAIQSVVAPATTAAPAVKNFAEAGNQLANALLRVAGAEEAATQSAERLAVAHGHAVTEIQATSGALRVLEGSQSIRAAERFITTALGLGPALQAIFPLVGAAAMVGILVKMGEEVYNVGRNFLFLHDAAERAVEIGKELAGQAESAFAKTASLQAEALRNNRKFVEAAKLEQQTLLSTPIKLPDLQSGENKKALEGVIGGIDSGNLEKLHAAFSEVIPADLNGRIQSIRASISDANRELKSAKENALGFGDVLSQHYASQAEVSVTLLSQALEFLQIKQKEVAQEIGVGGQKVTEAQKREASEIAAITIARVAGQQKANETEAELEKLRAEITIRSRRQTGEQIINSELDAHQRAVRVAELDVELAKDRAAELSAIEYNQTERAIQLASARAAAQGVGKTPEQQQVIQQETATEVAALRANREKGVLQLGEQVRTAEANLAEARIAQDRALTEGIIKEGERQTTELNRQVEAIVAASLKYITQQQKIQEISARSGGNLQSASFDSQKLKLERDYEAQVSHKGAQQLAQLQQIDAIEQKIRDAKVAGIDAESILALESGDVVKWAELAAKANEQAANNANKTYEEKTKELDVARKLTLQYQLQSSFEKAGKGAVNAVAGGISRGVFDGKGIGRDIRDSLKGVGQELFGNILRDSINQMVIHLGINTAAQTALGGILGVHTAAATAGAVATTANTGATIASTVSTVANTIATDLNTVWLAVKSLLGFADGGRPPVGVASIVGERGPELFVPDQAGQIIPAGKFGGLQAGVGTAISASSGGDLHIHGDMSFHGVQDVRSMMRQISAYAKSASPKHSPYNS